MWEGKAFRVGGVMVVREVQGGVQDWWGGGFLGRRGGEVDVLGRQCLP